MNEMEPGKLYFLVVDDGFYADENLVVQYIGPYSGEKRETPLGDAVRFNFHVIAATLPQNVDGVFGMSTKDFKRFCRCEVRPGEIVAYVHIAYKAPEFDRMLRGAA